MRAIPSIIAALLLGTVLGAVTIAGGHDNGVYPTVGSQDVPPYTHCAEDEAIGFIGIPDTLVCFNVPDLTEEYDACANNARWIRAALLQMVDEPDEVDIARDKVRDLMTGVAAGLEVCEKTGR